MLASGTVHSSLTYRILSIAQQLVMKGHTVTIMAPSCDKYSGYTKETFTGINGVRIVRPIQFNSRNVIISLLPYLLHATWKMLWCKADIIYLYKPTPATIMGLLPKVLRGTPVVVDMDDLGVEVLKNEQVSSLFITLIHWCELLATKYSSSMIVVSSFLCEEYRSKYPKKSITLIPNGTEVDRYQKAAEGKQIGRKEIIVLGAFNKTDFLDPLLTVLPRVIKRASASVHVSVIGNGQCLDELKEKASTLGIASHLTFVGWITKDMFVQYIHPGDIGYCFTADTRSNRACSNQKVFDYMALGAVPLVSRVGDLPTYVDNGSAGYIANADNEIALEDTLVEALSNDSDFNNKQRHVVEWTRSQYDWRILVGQVESELMRLHQMS